MTLHAGMNTPMQIEALREDCERLRTEAARLSKLEGPALMVVTAFRLRDEGALIACLRRLEAAVDEVEGFNAGTTNGES